MEKIYYHGGELENLINIVESSTAIEGYNNNDWSGIDEGLYISDNVEYAKQYGDYVIAIEIDDNSVNHIQECPLHMSDCFSCDKCKKNDDGDVEKPANEFLIAFDVQFNAWFME